MRFDSQLSRMSCQMFSMGFNSGALGGNGNSVMLAETSSLVVVCHLNWLMGKEQPASAELQRIIALLRQARDSG